MFRVARPFVARIAALAFAACAAIAGAQEEPGTVEIVRATAKKYSSLPRRFALDSPRLVPPAESAFLVVTVEADVTYDERGSAEREIVVESAKGNRRSPIGSLLADYGFDGFASQLERGLANSSAKTKLEWIFVVPVATNEASIVVGEEKLAIEFPDPPEDYPPVSETGATCRIEKARRVAELPPEGFPYDVWLPDETRVRIVPAHDPPYDGFVAIEVQIEGEAGYSLYGDRFCRVSNEDFVVTYEDGRPYAPLRTFHETLVVGDDGQFPSKRQEAFFPVPKNAKSGTLFWRQAPVGTFRVDAE